MTLTQADFWSEVRAKQALHLDWRYGQTAFNVLTQMRPDLAIMVRGGPADPFYVERTDIRVALFTEFIEMWWDR